MLIFKPRIDSHWSYADAKKEVLWMDPTRSSWSCHASPSHVFPPYFPLVIEQFSVLTAVTFTSDKHYGLLDLCGQQGVLDLCLVTDNSWPCLAWLMCICAISPYHLKLETDHLSENLCLLSNCEIMDTGQKPRNSSHCNILYTTKFINFPLDWPPLPPTKKENSSNPRMLFIMEPYFKQGVR